MKDVTPIAREGNDPKSGPFASTSQQQTASSGTPMADNSLARFMGGTPTSVFVRLVFVSLIVGALLMWLDIRPIDVFRGIERFVNRIWMLGFDAIREVAQYIFAGAVIVVPVWLILRLMNMRSAK
jgi:hypothetical protein